MIEQATQTNVDAQLRQLKQTLDRELCIQEQSHKQAVNSLWDEFRRNSERITGERSERNGL